MPLRGGVDRRLDVAEAAALEQREIATLGAAGEQLADPRTRVRLADDEGGTRALVLGHGAELVVRVVGAPLRVTVGRSGSDGGHEYEGGQGSEQASRIHGGGAE